MLLHLHGPTLQSVRLDGHPVLEVCHEGMTDGTLGRHLYHIFPDAWADGLDDVSATFDAAAVTPYRQTKVAIAGTNNQMSTIQMCMIRMRRKHMWTNHNIGRPIYPRSTRIQDPAPPGLVSKPPDRHRTSSWSRANHYLKTR